MSKYRVNTAAVYYGQYTVEAENTKDATELALDHAQEEHGDADEIMRVGPCAKLRKRLVTP